MQIKFLETDKVHTIDCRLAKEMLSDVNFSNEFEIVAFDSDDEKKLLKEERVLPKVVERLFSEVAESAPVKKGK